LRSQVERNRSVPVLVLFGYKGTRTEWLQLENILLRSGTIPLQKIEGTERLRSQPALLTALSAGNDSGRSSLFSLSASRRRQPLPPLAAIPYIRWPPSRTCARLHLLVRAIGSDDRALASFCCSRASFLPVLLLARAPPAAGSRACLCWPPGPPSPRADLRSHGRSPFSAPPSAQPWPSLPLPASLPLAAPLPVSIFV
jgi:hypothetical protein